MSVPAAPSASSPASESLAGPTVAMILVRRIRITIMGQIVPDLVERYLSSLNHQADALLEELAEHGRKNPLPLIDAEVGALLRVLATCVGATRILEVGTCI